MSLILSKRSSPNDLTVKTHGILFGGKNLVLLDGTGVNCEIVFQDFLDATMYMLTNTDLGLRDPRLRFIKEVSSLKQVDGYNPGGRHLGIP